MRTALDVDGQYRGRNPELAARVSGNPRGELGNPLFNAEHLYNFPHLSGNMSGTANTQIYVPGNYQRGSVTGPTRGDGVVTLYYPQSNATLAIFHVGGFGVRREGGRVTIGRTGGPGGGTAGNLHSHFELWRGRTGFLPPGAKRDAARIPFTPAFCP